MFRLFFLIIATSALFCREAPRETLLNMIGGEWVAKSIYTAAELDVAGHLLRGPKNVEELAQLTKTDTESLYRLLRLLSSVGVFYEGINRTFTNTPSSELLAKDHPQSLRTLALFYSEEMSQSFERLTDCVKTGKPAFDLAFEQPVFSYLKKHPQAASRFNTAMREKSQSVIASCLKACDFSRFKTVFDIGGGMGHFVAAILRAHPNVHGALYELPEVVSAARSSLETFVPRCTLISGDFFDKVPEQGDVYLLKSVLHDWTNEDALIILKNCHAAMSEKSKLIIIEPMMVASNQKEYAKYMDVFMMAITGGSERTQDEFKILLNQAGFTIESITPTETEFYIIEACKRD